MAVEADKTQPPREGVALAVLRGQLSRSQGLAGQFGR